uniref:Merozoite surface protein 1 n=1 Tax=Plasmodium falciparum (isolate ro-33 / Ghana) TaxID=5834 RepID=MSP1_PLAF3|nr:RecName: Full=Merozoite surface protein 1; AltName: Full=Merozoite surface antigen; AltName: Full=PMMSA; AltName: Full=p190; Contains: RecName: Full=p83 subunit; Contains: RecName: Full=p30 subunit; Contains: RecName: Full=p38 subunit; Contains: RecName: Full=p42 subunit; Contains: RecName: Full=p33 subunit; Contains: RecName: Full=p19 subunit; Flags: Precursor [Plasmodium falciparum RO-33]
MKIIFFLCSFLFFIINTQCVTHESYQELVKKLEALEDAVLTGYSLFQKEKMVLKDGANTQVVAKPADAVSTQSAKNPPGATVPSGTASTKGAIRSPGAANPSDDSSDSDAKSYADLKHRVQNYLFTIKELKYPELFDLTNHMLTLCDNIHGFKYLIDGYEEINELLYKLNFYFDLLRAKLNDVCANDYCQIPFNLKIRANELDVLKKLVFGYRKPLDFIKDNVGKMEDYIKKNKTTIANINELIEGSKKTIDQNKNADNEEGKKKLYQAQYDLFIYNKQLQEAHNLISVLEKRIDTLKKNENIKKLLEDIDKIKIDAEKPTTGVNQILSLRLEKESRHEEKIKEIAKTIKFNIDRLFTDPLELEYYLREKNKKVDVTPKSQDPTKSVQIPKVPYPNGIVYPLPLTDIHNSLAADNDKNSYGDLMNPHTKEKINEKIITDNKERKIFINNIKKQIDLEEKNINHTKEQNKKLLEDYEKSKKDYEELLEKFYEMKFNNNFNKDVVDKIFSARYTYNVEKQRYNNKFSSSNNSVYNVQKLKKALSYLEDYSLRKGISEKDFNHYYTLKTGLEADIKKLTEEIKSSENKILEKNFKGLTHSANASLEVSDIVKLQVQKVLLIKKIEDLRKIELFLKNAQLKDSIHVPNIYKPQNKPEPYYLIVLKKEVDKLKEFIPKVKDMLKKEQAVLSSITQPLVAASETTEDGGHSTHTLSQSGETEVTEETEETVGHTTTVTITLPPKEVKVVENSIEHKSNDNSQALTKTVYLKKLDEFLTKSYICHKYILVSNSSMDQKLLEVYNLTPEENELKSCDRLDLLFNIQNNIPAMYSLYDSMNNDLQHLFFELYQKEMIYYLHKLKEENHIKKLLEEPKQITGTSSTSSPGNTTVNTAQSATHSNSQNQQSNASSTNTQNGVAVSSGPAVVEESHDPLTVLSISNDLKGIVSLLNLGNKTKVPNPLTISTTEMEKFYENILKIMIPIFNDDIKQFVKSNSKVITGLTETQKNALNDEIKKLKDTLQLSFDLYNKYKLKLDRLFNKKKELGQDKMQIKKLTLLKEQLESKLNSLNNPHNVLQNFSVFFNKKKEAEIAETENTLENTKILLKHYKGLVKYYNGESSPLKTLSEVSIQTEDNYANLEKFRVLSKIDGKLNDNLHLGKKKLSFLSSGLHHLITELKEVIKNKNYTGNSPSENNKKVNEALKSYENFLPEAKVTTVVTPPQPDVTPSPLSVRVSGSSGSTKEETQIPTSGSLLTELQQVVQLQNYDEEDDSLVVLPIFGESEDNDEYLDQVVTGEAISVTMDNILSGFENEYDVIYLKPLAGVYRSLKKQIEKNIFTFNLNLNDILNSRLKKRKYFLDVLESDLMQFKHISSNEYIIEDSFKLLNSEQKNTLLKSYKYIKESVENDIKFAQEGISYYEKVLAKYKDDLESIKKVIKEEKEFPSSPPTTPPSPAKTDEQKKESKFLPFLTNIETLYNNLVNKIDDYLINLKAKINDCNVEKDEAHVKITKLSDLKAIDDKIDLFKNPYDFEAIKKLINDDTKKDMLGKLLSTGLVQNFPNTIISKLIEGKFQDMLNISQHQCVKKQCPQNSGCFRHLDEREECKCLLNYKQEGDKCVENPNPTCNENNGGCDADAKCTEEDSGSNGKKITCECTKPDSYPLFDGIFCSSSNFLGISFLLILMLILYSFI